MRVRTGWSIEEKRMMNKDVRGHAQKAEEVPGHFHIVHTRLDTYDALVHLRHSEVLKILSQNAFSVEFLVMNCY